MIWTLALMLGQFATPLGPKQYHYFSAQPRFTRPANRDAVREDYDCPPKRIRAGTEPDGQMLDSGGERAGRGHQTEYPIDADGEPA